MSAGKECRFAGQDIEASGRKRRHAVCHGRLNLPPQAADRPSSSFNLAISQSRSRPRLKRGLSMSRESVGTSGGKSPT